MNIEISELPLKDNSKVTETARRLISLANNLQLVKKTLSSYKNICIDYIFDKIGYEYKGKINNPNFLHLSAQSWIAGLFQELEKEINGNLSDLTYNSLLNLISQIIVKENVFIENMEVLIGKFFHLRPFTREDKTFRSMIIDLNSTKNEILKDEKITKNQEITEKEFYLMFEKILKSSFNIFLNNYNNICIEDNKKSLILYDNFEALKKENKLNFENFLNKCLEKKGITILSDKKIQTQIEEFYNFSLYSFEDLVEELELFNKNSISLIYKILSIFSKFELREFMLKQFNFLKLLGECNYKNLRIQRIKNFLETIYTNINDNYKNTFTMVDQRKEKIRNWINSIDYVKKTKEKSKDLFNKTYFFFQGHSKFAFDKINFFCVPIYEKTLQIKNSGIEIIFSIKDASIDKFICYKNIILTYIMLKYKNAIEYFIGKESLVKIELENKDYVSIVIKKKLFFVDPTKFFELIVFLQNLFLLNAKKVISGINSFLISE